MAKFDKEIIGDSQKIDWRVYDKLLKCDGVNDYGYWGNLGAGLWSGQPIHNFFNIDKAFSFSYRYKKIPGDSPTFLFTRDSNVSRGSESIFLSVGQVSFGQGNNFRVTSGIFDIEFGFGAVTYDGSQNPNNVKMYINSIDLDTIGQKIILDYGTRIINNYSSHFYSRQADPSFNFFVSQMCDIRFFDNQILTSEEVRKLYHGNWETNLGGRTELLRLPMTLPSHYANNTPVGLCSALDISGNNNHLNIVGQGTTPTLTNFY